MDHLAVTVEAVREDVEVGGVSGLVATEDGVGDVIGNLHAPERSRADEQRAVHDVANGVPLRTKPSELVRKLLKPGCVGALVQDDESLVIRAAQVAVEPAARTSRSAILSVSRVKYWTCRS